MCLSKIIFAKKNVPLKYRKNIGYKFLRFNPETNQYSLPFYNTKETQNLQIGKIYKDDIQHFYLLCHPTKNRITRVKRKNLLVTQKDSKFYTTGFHIYEKFEDAFNIETPTMKDERYVAKIEYDKTRYVGKQWNSDLGNTIVANRIKVISIQKYTI